jgi:hypothetical protein
VVRGVVGQTSLVRQAIGMHELKDIRGVTYQYIQREREREFENERGVKMMTEVEGGMYVCEVLLGVSYDHASIYLSIYL